MDIVGVLASINKIGLVAFLLTLGFLIYEVILLRKIKKSQAKPQIPQFQEGSKIIYDTQQSDENDGKKHTKKSRIIIIALTALLVLFGIVTFVGYMNLKLTRAKSGQSSPTPTSYIIAAKKNESPTPAATALSETPTPTEAPAPTEVLTPTEIPLTIEVSPTLSETIEPSPSPTVIEQLPETGYLNNLLILFSVAGLVIFFSFMF